MASAGLNSLAALGLALLSGFLLRRGIGAADEAFWRNFSAGLRGRGYGNPGDGFAGHRGWLGLGHLSFPFELPQDCGKEYVLET